MSNIDMIRRLSLPSVWETWSYEELDKFRLPELIALHMNMQRKIARVEDCIDRYKYFDDDEKYVKIFVNKREGSS
jgi:hypothetical protein